LDPVRQQKLIQEAIVMSKRNPVLMEQLLSQCPQLSYALVETLLVTNTAKPDAISQILLSNVKAEAQAQEQQQQQQQTQQQQQQQEEPLDEERIALIKQVIAIPDEDLQGLPEDQRLPILEIKQNYANGVYGTLSL
jgi:cleavage stimulation factor subunit 2